MRNTPQARGLDDRLCYKHPPSLQIDSLLTSRYPASSKLETEPQSHRQLPTPQRIANAGRQGLQLWKTCCTSTKDVVG